MDWRESVRLAKKIGELLNVEQELQVTLAKFGMGAKAASVGM